MTEPNKPSEKDASASLPGDKAEKAADKPASEKGEPAKAAAPEAEAPAAKPSEPGTSKPALDSKPEEAPPDSDPSSSPYREPDSDPALDAGAAGEPAAAVEMRPSMRPSYVPPPPVRDPRWPWLIAAVVATGLGAVGITMAYNPNDDQPKQVISDTVRIELPPLEWATQLRRDAEEDFTHHAWQACLDKLDHARTLDPKGEATLEVQRMRSEAAQALGQPEKATPPPDDKKPR